MTLRFAVLAFALVGLATACGGSSGGGREVEIIATDSGCSPASVTATTKEKLRLKVVNQAKGDRELEGIEGTKLDEVLIPSGRTRSINYATPSSAGTQKLKCYIPGGPTTIIEIRVS